MEFHDGRSHYIRGFFFFIKMLHISKKRKKCKNKKKNSCPDPTTPLQLSVFQLVRYEISKMHTKQPISDNETTIPETCHFGISKHIGTKTLKSMKNTLYGKTTLSKACFLSVFELLTYQTLKIRAEHPLWRN